MKGKLGAVLLTLALLTPTAFAYRDMIRCAPAYVQDGPQELC